MSSYLITKTICCIAVKNIGMEMVKRGEEIVNANQFIDEINKLIPNLEIYNVFENNLNIINSILIENYGDYFYNNFDYKNFSTELYILKKINNLNNIELKLIINNMIENLDLNEDDFEIIFMFDIINKDKYEK